MLNDIRYGGASIGLCRHNLSSFYYKRGLYIYPLCCKQSLLFKYSKYRRYFNWIMQESKFKFHFAVSLCIISSFCV
jgi:hypothetical protein